MKRVVQAVAVSMLCMAMGCSAAPDSETGASPAPTLAPTPTAPTFGPDAPQPEPKAYVPAGQPGSAQAYAGLIAKLENVVPDDLRAQVPWPDLRNPDPVVAQIEIFDLWIWMGEHLTEPQLVEVMTAPGSRSRELVTGVFGQLQSDNVFELRPGQPYQAFDHFVITFESAGLPLWLSRDVPADAVVLYYADNSGPVDHVDQDTGEFRYSSGSTPTRAWLSIMVPTDVGWQLWRDQLIEPNDTELSVPDVPPPPQLGTEPRAPEL